MLDLLTCCVYNVPGCVHAVGLVCVCVRERLALTIILSSVLATTRTGPLDIPLNAPAMYQLNVYTTFHLTYICYRYRIYRMNGYVLCTVTSTKI